jgi:sigma-E factor negative regulatory protein RseC
MLETPAVVLKTEARSALVEADFAGGCGSGMCAKGGCGTALLAQMFSQKPRAPLRVANPIDARIGERVIVGVEEGSLLRATLLVYLLPLALFLAGASAGGQAADGDAPAVLGGLAGLFLGWLAARRWSRRPQGGQPVILRRA